MQLLNAHPHGTVRSTGYHRVPPLRGARRAVCGILRRGEGGRERERERGRMFLQRLSYETVRDGDDTAHPRVSPSLG